MDSLAQKNTAETCKQLEMIYGMAEACERLEGEIIDIMLERNEMAGYFHSAKFLNVNMIGAIQADYDRKISDRQGELSDIKKNMQKMGSHYD